jgi:hypothetical protein
MLIKNKYDTLLFPFYKWGLECNSPKFQLLCILQFDLESVKSGK